MSNHVSALLPSMPHGVDLSNAAPLATKKKPCSIGVAGCVDGWIQTIKRDVNFHRDVPAYRPCVCQHQAAVNKTFSRGLPAGFRDNTFENFKADRQPKALEQVREWASGQRTPWVYIWGPTGTGKTHLACAAGLTMARRGVPTIVVVTPDAIDQMKPGQANPERVFQMLCTIPGLILDDFGAERKTDWVDETLYKIVNARYNAKLETGLTSNLPLTDMAQLGLQWQRITDRIFELASLVPMIGDSYRKNIAQQRLDL